uniref:Calponin-homology (CH) domain-containing protein n=1 Tax=Salarias fasciatus TaxID=181472 RepID=A0A672IQT0_SALFA
MALHHSEQQIVLKSGTMGKQNIDICATKQSCRIHTVYSFPDSDSASGAASRDTDDPAHRESSASLGVPEFPAASTEEGLYHQNVLLAAERWFSLFGWPGGAHPVTVPLTLRRWKPPDARQTLIVSFKIKTQGLSVADMLHHLTGGQIPGIPRCQALSGDIERRTHQLLQQHEAMLDFLRWASFARHTPPLMLARYRLATRQQWDSNRQTPGWSSSNDTEQSLSYTDVDYESLSKRSWTDVLLQTYKVLVLCRVSERDTKATPDRTRPDEVLTVGSASNVYSSRELQLLSWLNTHYHSMRGEVWVPSARWIVNFDLDLTDGLVLAALLAAYCPYLTSSHFRRMYTTPSSLEQILHNNIIVVQALTALGLNINVQVNTGRQGRARCVSRRLQSDLLANFDVNQL